LKKSNESNSNSNTGGNPLLRRLPRPSQSAEEPLG
jgi:hypothetical protein